MFTIRNSGDGMSSLACLHFDVDAILSAAMSVENDRDVDNLGSPIHESIVVAESVISPASRLGDRHRNNGMGSSVPKNIPQ